MVTVGQLIEALQRYPEDANVIIANQPHYPFEVELLGITTREQCGDDDNNHDGTWPTDVILAEGDQLRYGKTEVWDNLDEEW
jgi:hypothetical protein